MVAARKSNRPFAHEKIEAMTGPILSSLAFLEGTDLTAIESGQSRSTIFKLVFTSDLVESQF